jgi:isoleucyl-tRNA synthetase
MRAGRALEAYIDEISTWYLRRSRKRADVAFFATMHEVLLNLATMMAPLTPFVSEKIYQVLRGETMPESVHLCDWAESLGAADEAGETAMAQVRQAVEIGLSLRAAEKLKVRQPLATAFLVLPEGNSLSPELAEILADELNVRAVWVVAEPEPGVPCKEDRGMWVGLDTVLTDDLVQAGTARELLRHIQQIRKQQGLNPGQVVLLQVDPASRSVVEPLLSQYPEIVADAYLRIDETETWVPTEANEVDLNGRTVAIALKP